MLALLAQNETFFALFSNSVPSCINRILQSLPWYGRRSKLRRAKAKVRWVQRPKRQGHKLEAKASRVWTKLSGPQSYIRWRRFFHWKCKSIFQDIFFVKFLCNYSHFYARRNLGANVEMCLREKCNDNTPINQDTKKIDLTFFTFFLPKAQMNKVWHESI